MCKGEIDHNISIHYSYWKLLICLGLYKTRQTPKRHLAMVAHQVAHQEIEEKNNQLDDGSQMEDLQSDEEQVNIAIHYPNNANSSDSYVVGT